MALKVLGSDYIINSFYEEDPNNETLNPIPSLFYLMHKKMEKLFYPGSHKLTK